MSDPGIVTLHIQPRAARTEVSRRHGNAIKIRITAPPVGGAANDELIRFLSRRLRVPRSAVRLVSGRSSRRKRVAVQGLDAETVARKLLKGGGKQR